MRVTSRGVGHAVMLLACLVVLLGFVVAMAYGLGHALLETIGGVAEDGG